MSVCARSRSQASSPHRGPDPSSAGLTRPLEWGVCCVREIWGSGNLGPTFAKLVWSRLETLLRPVDWRPGQRFSAFSGRSLACVSSSALVPMQPGYVYRVSSGVVLTVRLVATPVAWKGGRTAPELLPLLRHEVEGRGGRRPARELRKGTSSRSVCSIVHLLPTCRLAPSLTSLVSGRTADRGRSLGAHTACTWSLGPALSEGCVPCQCVTSSSAIPLPASLADSVC